MTHVSSCRPSSSSAFLLRHPAAVASFRPSKGAAVARDSVAIIPRTSSTVSESMISSTTSLSLSFGHDHASSRAVLPISTIENKIIDTATAAIVSSPPTTTTATSFEAVPPDPVVILGMGFVLLLCIAASYVWANEVVPVSRTKLAISKSRGEVRQYLDGLRQSSETILNQEDDDERDDERNHIPTSKDDSIHEIPPNVVIDMRDGRDFERWLFSDWLNKPIGSKGGRQKEPALPILREAKWNSGDNPVLVTVAIMMLGAVLASITERIAT